jgi:YfiH family protein
MSNWQADTPSGVILTHTTNRAEGDFAIDGEPVALAERRRMVADHPWVWLRQVHGADVVAATRENAAEVAGTRADAMVTADAELVLAIQTADCVPISFWSDNGVIGAAHAGWRGIEAGVVGRTVDAMRVLGAERIRVTTGPFIEGACYEFGAADLDRLAARFGKGVRTTTGGGRPALDLHHLVEAELDSVVGGSAGLSCTACQPDLWFSHRARTEAGRMATVIWRESSYEKAMASG